MSVTVFPEGMTDPDERDRWLEARDSHHLTNREELDAAVMAAAPRDRPHLDAVTDPDQKAAIAARLAYLSLPWWQRWFTPRPAGLINRHPTGPFTG